MVLELGVVDFFFGIFWVDKCWFTPVLLCGMSKKIIGSGWEMMFESGYARSVFGCVFVALFLLYPVCVGQGEESAGWLSSTKGMRFRLGGELEFEYVDTQNDAGIGQPSGHFQIDKFTLKPHVRIAGNIILESLLLFKVDGAYASEAYVHRGPNPTRVNPGDSSPVFSFESGDLWLNLKRTGDGFQAAHELGVIHYGGMFGPLTDYYRQG